MKHVSELLMNGDSASEVVDKNFEISRVSLFFLWSIICIGSLVSVKLRTVCVSLD